MNRSHTIVIYSNFKNQDDAKKVIDKVRAIFQNAWNKRHEALEEYEHCFITIPAEIGSERKKQWVVESCGVSNQTLPRLLGVLDAISEEFELERYEITYEY